MNNPVHAEQVLFPSLAHPIPYSVPYKPEAQGLESVPLRIEQ